MEKNLSQIDITHCAKKLRSTRERASERAIAAPPELLVVGTAVALSLSQPEHRGGGRLSCAKVVNADEEVPMEPRENRERKLEQKKARKGREGKTEK